MFFLKLKAKLTKESGGQPIFTLNEEMLFVSHIIALGTFGFPVTTTNLQINVHAYLEKMQPERTKIQEQYTRQGLGETFSKTT